MRYPLLSLLLVIGLTAQAQDKKSRRAQEERDQLNKQLVADARSATNSMEFQRANELYTQALGMWYDLDVARARAMVRLRLNDSTGYCADISPAALFDKGVTILDYQSICTHSDTVPFSASGLSPSSFPGIVRVVRTVSKADSRTRHTLLDDQGSINAILSTAPGDTLFLQADVDPGFPGGEEELNRFLGRTIRYPAHASDAGIMGKLYVQFVVGKDGTLRSIDVARSAHYTLDEEALRVVHAMPPWTPARFRSRPVDFLYFQPVSFILR